MSCTQAFLFRVWVEGGQVQVVHWLLTSSPHRLHPPHQPRSHPGISPKRVLAPGRCHHTAPGDPESFHGTGSGCSVTCLYTVSVGCLHPTCCPPRAEFGIKPRVWGKGDILESSWKGCQQPPGYPFSLLLLIVLMKVNPL